MKTLSGTFYNTGSKVFRYGAPKKALVKFAEAFLFLAQKINSTFRTLATCYTSFGYNGRCTSLDKLQRNGFPPTLRLHKLKVTGKTNLPLILGITQSQFAETLSKATGGQVRASTMQTKLSEKMPGCFF